MFGIGLTEAIILGFIVMILLGPKQIPEIMKGAGKLFREIAKARQDFTRNLEQDEEFRKIRDSVQDVKQTVDGHVDTFKASVEKDLKKFVEEKNSISSEIAETKPKDDKTHV